MPLLRIRHSTTYTYARPVRFTRHRLMVRPRDSHDLRVLRATLQVTPPAATTRWAHDVFGNSVCLLDLGAAEAAELRIVSTLDVEHFPSAEELPLDPSAEIYPFLYAAEEFPDLARLIERHYPDPEGLVDSWAQRFIGRHGHTETMRALIAMTEAIRSDFTYQGRVSEGTQTPLETLASKTGACRDFAVLLMEAVRSLGLAARFVSGYLYDREIAGRPGAFVGGGATHAWCNVYLPGAGWVEFDPTNGLIAGRNLIRVCTARTPGQAVPIAGGYVGQRQDFIGLAVNVEVSSLSVKPEES